MSRYSDTSQNFWFTDKKGRRFMCYAVPIRREATDSYAPWLDSRPTRYSIEYRDSKGRVRHVWSVRRSELEAVTVNDMLAAAFKRFQPTSVHPSERDRHANS